MTEEQRQAAWRAINELADWANKGVNVCTRGKTVPDIFALKKIVVEAIQAPPISETQLESETKKTAMNAK